MVVRRIQTSLGLVDFPESVFRAWTGVPYVKGGRSNTGADCWGVVVGIAEGLGFSLPPLSPEHYNMESVESEVRKLSGMKRIGFAFAEPGDVVYMTHEGSPHAGIVVAPGWMITTTTATGSFRARLSLYRRTIRGIYRLEYHTDDCIESV
jgi:cell wall-associated NlpC family hydrolase